MKHLIALMLFLSCLASALQASTTPQDSAPTRPGQVLFERGIKAYRAGDFAEAEAHWEACFEEPLNSSERGRVAHNLGNSAHRRGDELQAVGWYTLGLRHTPRKPELWENLEFVRAAAGLEAADGGDLADTFKRLMKSVLPSEARGLFGLGLGILLLCFLGEAFRGGRFWSRMICMSLVLTALMATPWICMQRSLESDPLLIVGTPSVALRSEPRLSLSSTGKLLAGREVERLDELPGWVRVQDVEGQRGWVQESAVFELRR